MTKDPAFLFYPGDYLRDTQCFSEKTQVAYDRIMCEHMRNICITQQQLKFFTKRLDEQELAELMHCLKAIDGGYQIEWIAESIEKRRAYSDSRRKNRTSHIKTYEKDMKSYVPHMENEIENEIVIENGIKKEDEVSQIFEFWKSELGHPRALLDRKREKVIKARLKEGYSVQRIKEAIVGIKNIPHNMGKNENNQIYDDIELICRNGSNVDRFADAMNKKTSVTKRMNDLSITKFLEGEQNDNSRVG